VCRNGPSDKKALIRWKSKQNRRTETSPEKSEETLHEALIQRTDKNLRKSKQLMNTIPNFHDILSFFCKSFEE
jgi:hypothetical protein